MARSLNSRGLPKNAMSRSRRSPARSRSSKRIWRPLFRRERSRTHLTDLGREILPLFETTHEATQAAQEPGAHIGKAQVAPLTLGIANTIENDDLHVFALVRSELTCRGSNSTAAKWLVRGMIELGLTGALDLFVVEAPGTRSDRSSLVVFDACLSYDRRSGAPVSPSSIISSDEPLLQREFEPRQVKLRSHQARRAGRHSRSCCAIPRVSGATCALPMLRASSWRPAWLSLVVSKSGSISGQIGQMGPRALAAEERAAKIPLRASGSRG